MIDRNSLTESQKLSLGIEYNYDIHSPDDYIPILESCGFRISTTRVTEPQFLYCEYNQDPIVSISFEASYVYCAENHIGAWLNSIGMMVQFNDMVISQFNCPLEKEELQRIFNKMKKYLIMWQKEDITKDFENIIPPYTCRWDCTNKINTCGMAYVCLYNNKILKNMANIQPTKEWKILLKHKDCPFITLKNE